MHVYIPVPASLKPLSVFIGKTSVWSTSRCPSDAASPQRIITGSTGFTTQFTRFPGTKVQIMTLLAASQSALYLRGGAGPDEAEDANAQVLDANGSPFLIVP
jgi:hypothetical protein